MGKSGTTLVFRYLNADSDRVIRQLRRFTGGLSATLEIYTELGELVAAMKTSDSRDVVVAQFSIVANEEFRQAVRAANHPLAIALTGPFQDNHPSHVAQNIGAKTILLAPTNDVLSSPSALAILRCALQDDGNCGFKSVLRWGSATETHANVDKILISDLTESFVRRFACDGIVWEALCAAAAACESLPIKIQPADSSLLLGTDGIITGFIATLRTKTDMTRSSVEQCAEILNSVPCIIKALRVIQSNQLEIAILASTHANLREHAQSGGALLTTYPNDFEEVDQQSPIVPKAG